MARDEKQLYPKLHIFKIVLRNKGHIYFIVVSADCVDFDAVLEIIGNRNNLRVVTFYIDLFYFSLAEASDIPAQKIFKQK